MEKNITIDTYFTLSKKGLAGTQKEASKEALESYGEKDGKEDLLFGDVKWEVDELYFDKEDMSLNLSGEFFYKGSKLGYFSPNIPLGSETIIEIIEHRLKQLGKLKTVMEAIKD